MKRNRVDCANCTNFEFPQYDENLFLGKVKNAKCKLGKRVMFRKPENFYDGGGWLRYCDEFNDKINKK